MFCWHRLYFGQKKNLTFFLTIYIYQLRMVWTLTSIIKSHRQGAAGGRGQRVDQGTGGPKLPRGIPAPNANAELVTSVQVPDFLAV